MTIPLDLIESDAWPVLRQKIIEKRADCLGGLLRVATLDAMCRQQGFVHALDWILDEAKPKPPPRENDDA